MFWLFHTTPISDERNFHFRISCMHIDTLYFHVELNVIFNSLKTNAKSNKKDPSKLFSFQY